VFELAGFPTNLGLACKKFDRLFKASFCFTYSPLCLPPPFVSSSSSTPPPSSPIGSGYDGDPFGFKRCIRPTCFMNLCLYVEALLSASSLSQIVLPPPPSVPHLTSDNASFQSFMDGMEVFILGYERNVKTLFASKGLIEAACLISIWSGRQEALEEVCHLIVFVLHLHFHPPLPLPLPLHLVLAHLFTSNCPHIFSNVRIAINRVLRRS
jgi:hypothetical protein